MKQEPTIRSQSSPVSSVGQPEFPSLTEDLTTEVVVVGGGIAGLSVAYALTRAGRKCVVIERNLVGGATGLVSSAHLADAIDGRYFRLQNIYGIENSRGAAKSHSAAINHIDEIVAREHIECDFKRLDGYLFLHPSDRIKTLRQEFEASRLAGLRTELVRNAPGIRLRERISLKFPAQAQFNPWHYAYGLCRAITDHGGKIFTHTRAVEIDETGVRTTHARISADHVVIATNAPGNNHTRQLAYQSYMMGATITKGSIDPALWWDTGDQHSVWSTCPYHYARIHPLNDEFDLLVCGGEDHKTGEADDVGETDRFANLEAWAYDHFPGILHVVHKWSGQLTEPVDALGYIGRSPGKENIFVVTCDAGNGLTYAAIAGMLIPDLIEKRANPWEELYDPSRSTVEVLSEFLTEASDLSVRYLDFRTPGDAESEHALSHDEGAIIRIHGKRIAVYRDSEGSLHARRANCPHEGCSLRWNSIEKTFDCPCLEVQA